MLNEKRLIPENLPLTREELCHFRNILAIGIANKIVEGVVKRTDLTVDKLDAERYPPPTQKKEE